MAQGSDQFGSLTAGTTLQGRQLEIGSQYWQIETTGSIVGADGGGAVRAAKNVNLCISLLTTSTSGVATGITFSNVSDCGQRNLVSANVRFTGTLGEVRVIALYSRSSAQPTSGTGGHGVYEYGAIYASDANMFYRIRKIVNAVDTSLGTSSTTFTSGTWCALSGFTSDAVKALYADGQQLITSTDNAVTYTGSGMLLYQEGSGIGASKTCELDNFIVSPPPKSVSAVARQAVQRAATR